MWKVVGCDERWIPWVTLYFAFPLNSILQAPGLKKTLFKNQTGKERPTGQHWLVAHWAANLQEVILSSDCFNNNWRWLGLERMLGLVGIEVPLTLWPLMNMAESRGNLLFLSPGGSKLYLAKPANQVPPNPRGKPWNIHEVFLMNEAYSCVCVYIYINICAHFWNLFKPNKTFLVTLHKIGKQMTSVLPLLYSHQETEIALEKEPLVLCLPKACAFLGLCWRFGRAAALGEITCCYLDVVNQSAFVIYHSHCKNNE